MYRCLSLLRLAELIAHNGDRKALQELHDLRKVFYYHSNQPLRLAEFADKLRQSDAGWRWCNQNAEVLEKAYDLTIGKFGHLPGPNRAGRDVHWDGPDCRYYFKAFITHTAERLETEAHSSETEREIYVARLLQKFMIRHFRLSCMECYRRVRKLSRRYLWKLDGYTLSVLLPTQMPGSQCRQWLKDNVPDVDPARPGERDRVQIVVDRLLVRRKVISLASIDPSEIADRQPPSLPDIEPVMTVQGLADVVANEKAATIESQRAAIRELGSDKLKQLIHQIFDSLAHGAYRAMNTADSFGISRVTFSRFAGRSWLAQADEDTKLQIPDLWLNTARTLAGHPAFVSAARAAGILGRVEQMLECRDANRSGT
ncbi:hypothetical protein ACFL6U_02905 [Planctomycetota bacterium]